MYILYSERSGSNLLRVLLGNHPTISAPVPPQFYDSFMPYADRFGNLKQKENSIRTISMMKRYANHPFSNWELETDAEAIYNKFHPSNFVEIIDALYAANALQNKKTGYVCKENHLFNYAGLISSSLTHVNWLYLYRDARDVVSSWLKNKVLFFTAFKAAQSWAEEQKTCLSLKKAHNLDYLQLSYEELVTDTRETMTTVLEYLSLSIDERCFYNKKERAEAKRNVLWKNLDKPIDASNTKNYLNVLSDKQLQIVETICKEQMLDLHYDLETSARWHPLLGKKRYKYYNEAKEVLKKMFWGKNKTSELIEDRNKLKMQLINSL